MTENENVVVKHHLDLKNNELGISFFNLNAVEFIFNKCFAILIERGEIKEEHFASLLLSLQSIDEYLVAINDRFNMVKFGKTKVIHIKINTLMKNIEALQAANVETQAMVSDLQSYGKNNYAIAKLCDQIAKNEIKINNYMEQIELLKESQNYYYYEYNDNNNGSDFRYMGNDRVQFTAAILNILRNVGLTPSAVSALHKNLNEVSVTLFESGMLNE